MQLNLKNAILSRLNFKSYNKVKEESNKDSKKILKKFSKKTVVDFNSSRFTKEQSLALKEVSNLIGNKLQDKSQVRIGDINTVKKAFEKAKKGKTKDFKKLVHKTYGKDIDIKSVKDQLFYLDSALKEIAHVISDMQNILPREHYSSFSYKHLYDADLSEIAKFCDNKFQIEIPTKSEDTSVHIQEVKLAKSGFTKLYDMLSESSDQKIAPELYEYFTSFLSEPFPKGGIDEAKQIILNKKNQVERLYNFMMKGEGINGLEPLSVPGGVRIYGKEFLSVYKLPDTKPDSINKLEKALVHTNYDRIYIEADDGNIYIAVQKRGSLKDIEPDTNPLTTFPGKKSHQKLMSGKVIGVVDAENTVLEASVNELRKSGQETLGEMSSSKTQKNVHKLATDNNGNLKNMAFLTSSTMGISMIAVSLPFRLAMSAINHNSQDLRPLKTALGIGVNY